MKNIWVSLLSVSLALFQYVEAAEESPSGSKCKKIQVRKEWRALSWGEKKAWIDAVNCLNRRPASGNLKPPVNTSEYGQFNFIPPVSPGASYSSELVYTHMNLNPLIHFTGLFLPWHRLYVHEFTDALRKQCGYKGVAPYWAWENDAADFENSSIWDPDPVVGLGGFGDPNDDYIVKTGALNLTLTYPVTHKLRRKYQPFPFAGSGLPGFDDIQANKTFTPAEVQALLAQPTGNFTAFQYYMEKFDGMHGLVHGIVGGDLAGRCPRGSDSSNCPFEGAPTFSSNEPLFHLHHGNIDRLWWLWQEKGNGNKYAFHGGSVQNLSAVPQFPNGVAPWLNKSDIMPTAGMCTNLVSRARS
ncbi:hypothetical protein CTheo_6478 [Ceratobasidium theobromae]|uniref:Tyrosinase copper-binding domain-containing protein n=1 Tax=Ceratobasidium theobromae TaxID=1582974 RepID=A0A5N5QF46_9AGAM|nr:hypothetical protein CTheo_6478 [Ceratobasidium theobromae]